MKFTQFLSLNLNSLCLNGMAASLAFLAIVSQLASAAPTVISNLKTQVHAKYGKLPLSFEANQGQTDAQVKFLARGQGYALFLTPSETVLSLHKPQTQPKAAPSSENSSFLPEQKSAVLHMQFVGANSAPRIVGKEVLPGKVNYLTGKGASQWRTQAPTYGKVAYRDVYPGVDLVYYGNQGQLEYDFVVAPKADPHAVQLAFKGADHIAVNPAGDLVLSTAAGDIRMHKPVIYQEIAGIRKPVDGGYVLKEDQAVGFQVAAYDNAHPLVIDPVLVYHSRFANLGFGNVYGLAIAVDQQGRAYVTGHTESSEFPTENALQPIFGGGNYDAFVTQLSADGATLLYSTYLGGHGADSGSAIAVDQKGRAYVTGSTDSTDFPIKNALQPAFKGGDVLGGDAFVAQLSADGSELVYSTYLGGSASDRGFSIAVDRKGRAYMTGGTRSNNFPTENALQPAYGGGEDAFIAQLSADGSALLYSTYLGGDSDENGVDIAVDRKGRAYVSGNTSSSDFPTQNALQPGYGGGTDAFVAQLVAEGSELIYSTYLGGSASDEGTGIAVDQWGRAYVSGNTTSTDFPTENALQHTLNGSGVFSHDAFVARLSADGSALDYSTYLGGSGNDQSYDIAVDQRGQTYVTGLTNSLDFPTKNAIQPDFVINPEGQTNTFVTQMSVGGSALVHSTYLRSTFASGIAVDQRGQAYITGTIIAAFNKLYVTKIGSAHRKIPRRP